MKTCASFLTFILCLLLSQGHAISKAAWQIDAATGKGIAAWEAWDTNAHNFVIRAAIWDSNAHYWTPSNTLSDPKTSSRHPKVAINQNGSIAVIWTGAAKNLNQLYGTTFNQRKFSWNSPALLSSKGETLLSGQNYFVTISAADEVSIIYTSSDEATSLEQIKALISPNYGKWNLPAVCIDP